MRCEQCLKEIESVICGHCGKVVLPLGSFCYSCGQKLATVPSANGENDTENVDFSSRVLCSDGACIGVVDEKGFCKVCGKPYSPET